MRAHDSEGDGMSVESDAVEFLQGWVSGYLAHGGDLTDEGLSEKAVVAYERRLHPPDFPEPVRILLDDAIAAAQDVAQRSVSVREPRP
jgi:hypothetical protein